jgi:hypothetical protein
VVLAVVTVLSGGSDGKTATPSPAASSGRPSAAGCSPSDTSQDIPHSAPAGVTWSLFHAIAVPSSPAAGPLIIEGDVARCYAHTPLGALLANVQISTRFFLGPGWRTVTEAQVMPGPNRDIWIRNRSKVSGNPDQPGSFGQSAGFRFTTYTPQTAVIQVVSRGPDGGLWVYTETMVWDGDWKLQLTPDGSASPQPQQVRTLDGFIAWGGT